MNIWPLPGDPNWHGYIPPTLGVVCGRCSGPVFMATCHHFRGTGHEWTLVSICLLCRSTHWTKEGCLDCQAGEES